MGQFITQFKELLAGLSLVRKISMALVLVLAIASISYLVHSANQASFEPLFTNLNSQDMGTILTQLDKQGTRYQVDQDQRTILVPATEVLDARLKLASEGLPRFGGVGFELFDKGSFGMSEFEQRVNYQRALEGELSRTISNVKEIESARVHLVLPERSLFADSQQSATASVIVKMGGSGSLSQGKVSSITHLVASAVQSLDPNQVTVVDTSGNLLTKGGTEETIGAGHAFDQKLQIEKSFEKRIVELLNPIIGFGKVVARVSVDMDFTRTESTDEILDPTKSAVLTESRTTAKRQESASGSGGAAGAAANLPGGAGGGGAAGNSGSSDEGSEKITYEVSKTVRKQIKPVGGIKALSVAILVDGTYETKEDGTVEYKPRDAEEIKKVEELVKNAIGFTQDRGDSVKVENLAFLSPEDQFNESAAWYEQKNTYSFLITIIGNVMVVLVVLLVFLFVVRPLIKTWSAGREGQEGGSRGLLEGDITSDVTQLVQSDPLAAARAIRQWLK